MEQVSLGKIGRYDVIKVLGRGGMGEVLLAQDENLGRRVAIKRPFKTAIAEGLARFQVEAKAATLRHPNIPAVYEMGVHEDLPFIAMEFVEGETLEKLIESKKDLDLMTKLSIMEQVCSALGYAHQNGVIHRDIKPANIIVQPDGVAKIIDFGIAKVQDDQGSAGLTKASQLIGSLHYIAPERFWGGPTDGRVDIFSVGVTLFKLLTGREPFTGGEATASFKIMNEAHSTLAAYLHEYPPVLDEIIAKSLAKNPADRYQTGEDFADALHEVIEELKQTRVAELFNDAERLTTEKRFAPALELLDEAIKLDPSNTQARKLRKFVREHQERIRRADRLRDALLRGDEALAGGNYDEALAQLREAQGLDSESADIKTRIQAVEDKKRRYEFAIRSLGEAEIAKSRGDINGAMRIVARALQEDPENKKAQAAQAALARQIELETQRARLLELLEQAARALATRDLDAAEKLLNEAGAIDASNVETDKLRRELTKAREAEQRRAALEEIEQRVHEFIRSNAYESATDLLNRALERLPNETMLHRLKAEVDAQGRNYEARRFVESAINQARDLFAASPFEALDALEKALEKTPGDERLIAYQASLRQDLEARRSEQLREDTVLKARELMSSRQFEKAASVLESYQLEFGAQDDIDALLVLVRNELAAQRRKELVERASSEARALVRDRKFDEAVRVLEPAARESGDPALSALLNDVREQQAAVARKLEAVQKKVELLQQRGELDEAIALVQEQLAETPANTGMHRLSATLQAERERRRATSDSLRRAAEAAQQNDYATAIESVQVIVRAYGDSPELTHAVQELEAKRSTHAQETVDKAVEAARACLLKNDPQGALEALKTATPFLEYAGDQKQAEWQRIGQSVKKALQQAGPNESSAAFDDELAAIARVKPRRMPLWAVAAAFLVVIGVAVVLILRSRTAQPVAVTQIEIPKLPSGATVLIDGVPQKVGPDGRLKVAVKPGHHELTVNDAGFEAYNDSMNIDSGQTYVEKVSLTPLPPAGVATGTFAVFPQNDLPVVKVFVNGDSKGEKHAGQKIMLPVGTYHVRYAWPGYKDSADHVVQIAKGDDYADRVVLEKLPQVAQTPRDQQHATPAPATPAAPQQAAPVPVAPAQPTGKLDISASSIERGQPVSLAWSVQNSSSVEIVPLGKVDPYGARTVYPTTTTTYELMANGTQIAAQTVQVHEPQKAQAPAPAPAAPTPAAAQPTGPDRATLEHAVTASYASIFARASGKSGKECKAAFTGVFGGKLKAFTDWCDLAKSFTPAVQCSQIGGSPDAPTLTCTERVSVRLKDGGAQDFPQQQKVFHFTKGAEGSWQVAGW